MKKVDLISITLDQLIENANISPECFEINCRELNHYANITSDIIIWKRRVNVNGENIPDPNGDLRTIFIYYSHNLHELSCHIYLKEMTISQANGTKADASMSIPITFKWLNREYRKFKQIKDKIMEYERQRENDAYLRKLYSIFPGTFEKDILGKK